MKTKILTATVLSLLLIFTAAGCINYDANDTKAHNESELGDFNKINITGVSHLKLINSDTQSISIDAGQKNIQNITYKVVNETLEITAEKYVKSNQDTEITVYYKELNEIAVAGVHDVEADAPITTENLTVKVDGTNNVDLKIKVTNFTLNVVGVDNIDVEGTAQNVTVLADGTSNVDLEDLKAVNVTVTANGVSNIDVYASETLSINLDGASKLSYAGNPANVNNNVSAVSTVVKKN
ncbi:hypothetical protein MsAg5_11560 [Methanosarcinaceae archaeon Ag5]|uniref:Putative auto-transporter adhesin head GIN domain-containing protein n=1 Tax=Methanolapillus africanus TaxID=3028297 RepID=A0AAE4MK02_9EURY|nr:hypothetical protein [Methanosarcinaceae archaeon Ag5]